jgi:hypothetical protein
LELKMPYSFVLPAAPSVVPGTDTIPIAYPNGYIISGYVAGTFKVGVTYTIQSVSNTDFTLIGASANTVGVSFIATGVGSGSGTASAKEYILYATLDQIVSTSLLTGNYKVNIGSSFGRGAPITKTANFTVGDTENWLINNKTGSSCTVTLPTAASYTGREIMIQNWQAFTVISASSNVIPLAGGVASTSILLGTAGKRATLVSNGTNWQIVDAN